MSKQNENVQHSSEPVIQLSAEQFSKKKIRNNQQKKIIQSKTSKPPVNSIKTKPIPINVHFKWALTLVILCFFTIGPCWALYKTFELRRMIKNKNTEEAMRLSSKISTVLVVSTIFGVFIWVSMLFCSVGLLLTGTLLLNNFI